MLRDRAAFRSRKIVTYEERTPTESGAATSTPRTAPCCRRRSCASHRRTSGSGPLSARLQARRWRTGQDPMRRSIPSTTERNGPSGYRASPAPTASKASAHVLIPVRPCRCRATLRNSIGNALQSAGTHFRHLGRRRASVRRAYRYADQRLRPAAWRSDGYSDSSTARAARDHCRAARSALQPFSQPPGALRSGD
jgi:hypothetical protein